MVGHHDQGVLGVGPFDQQHAQHAPRRQVEFARDELLDQFPRVARRRHDLPVQARVRHHALHRRAVHVGNRSAQGLVASQQFLKRAPQGHDVEPAGQLVAGRDRVGGARHAGPVHQPHRQLPGGQRVPHRFGGGLELDHDVLISGADSAVLAITTPPHVVRQTSSRRSYAASVTSTECRCCSSSTTSSW